MGFRWVFEGGFWVWGWGWGGFWIEEWMDLEKGGGVIWGLDKVGIRMELGRVGMELGLRSGLVWILMWTGLGLD